MSKLQFGSTDGHKKIHIFDFFSRGEKKITMNKCKRRKYEIGEAINSKRREWNSHDIYDWPTVTASPSHIQVHRIESRSKSFYNRNCFDQKC